MDEQGITPENAASILKEWIALHGTKRLATRLLQLVCAHYQHGQPPPRSIETERLIEDLWSDALQGQKGARREATYRRYRDSYWVHKKNLNDALRKMSEKNQISLPIAIGRKNTFIVMREEPAKSYNAVKALARKLKNVNWLTRQFVMTFEFSGRQAEHARITRHIFAEALHDRPYYKHQLNFDGQIKDPQVKPGLMEIKPEIGCTSISHIPDSPYLEGTEYEFTCTFVVTDGFRNAKEYWHHQVNSPTFGTISFRFVFPPRRQPKTMKCLWKPGPGQDWRDDRNPPILRQEGKTMVAVWQAENPAYMSEYRLEWEW